ncbi:MAG: hypothetical protein RJA02_1988 [Armatimonadota bacterium]|jgi:hypothetical protein
MLAMRHSDGDKMKKVLLGAVAAIAITGAANAQFGTWYTNQGAWTAAVSGIQTENYTNIVTGSQSVNSGFGGLVTSTSFFTGFMQAAPGITTVDAAAPVTFSFTSGNAFAFVGGITTINGTVAPGNLAVSASDGGTYTFGSTDPFSFLGYVSNSASLSSVGVTGPLSNYLQFSSFSLGSVAQNPGGGNGGAVPEPGTVVSMGLLGAGVLGLVVRSRRRISN